MQASVQDDTGTDAREQTWLLRVADGDRTAFEQLYHATSARLLGICLRVLPDRAEAEDVLQDVYVAIWRKAPQFSPERSSAMTWLAAIARHRAIDRLRATPALASRQPIELMELGTDPDAAPSARVEADSERSQLDRCLGQLDARGRTLIRTAFFDGATYEDLARRTGSPLGSIKSWIRRGLLQLRACLEA
jgi:RNA polymerase sigma-70 factor, ECF subfamily